MGEQQSPTGVNLMHTIREFCEKRKCNKRITDAFVSYCRSSISDYYQIGDGKTVTGILMSFTEEEIEKMWGEFVLELRSVLPQQ